MVQIVQMVQKHHSGFCTRVPHHSIIFFEPSPSNPMLPHRVLPPLPNEAPPTEKHLPTDCKILK